MRISDWSSDVCSSDLRTWSSSSMNEGRTVEYNALRPNSTANWGGYPFMLASKVSLMHSSTFSAPAFLRSMDDAIGATNPYASNTPRNVPTIASEIRFAKIAGGWSTYANPFITPRTAATMPNPGKANSERERG